ncbi:MAG: bacteriochlorophyll 4-vinyl reductase [Gemmatimonadaceae bacterium]|nr:bacteriochlorophyll 4-vinyl reductase [Gemmatimonadaceae bacterium]
MLTSEIAAISSPARIGPNAIIQVALEVEARFGRFRAEQLVFDATGYRLEALPTEMVPESEAQALARALVRELGVTLATNILREAGHRTGDYLLANRIPRVAQWVMRLAPRHVALNLLLRAMQANAWTFAGSGHFLIAPSGESAKVPDLVFTSCAMCRDMHESQPMCDFYAGTFERLIRVLVSSYAGVFEVECMAQGDARCRFELQGIA